VHRLSTELSRTASAMAGLCLLAAGCTGSAAKPAAAPSAAPAVQAPARSAAAPVPAQPSPSSVPTTASASTAVKPVIRAPGPPGLVWMAAPLPAAVLAGAARLSRSAQVVAVANGTVWLPARTGNLQTPIDVSAADPKRYAAAVPSASVLARLVPGQVVLSADSARLRGLRVGDRTAPGGVPLTVAAIVADPVIGYAEMFVTAQDGHRLRIPAARYLLVRPLNSGAWPAIARTMRTSAAGKAIRIVAPGKAVRLREANAVLSPLEEKLRFGEFTADPQVSAAGDIGIDPAWLQAHIVTASVPILGAVTCNRAFLPALRSALAEVVREGLQALIRRSDYGGCFNARLIAGQAGESISHHTFGSAIDLNVAANPQGVPGTPNVRLVKAFAKFGLTWGGSWLVPDGMHFEALGGRS
jgi:hypothetical protein